jgi:hypothetical protein
MIVTNADQTYQQAAAERALAARRLHEAEIAAHDANQTQVDEWIRAAHDRLHVAVTRYLAADAALTARTRPHPTPATLAA